MILLSSAGFSFSSAKVFRKQCSPTGPAVRLGRAALHPSSATAWVGLSQWVGRSDLPTCAHQIVAERSCLMNGECQHGRVTWTVSVRVPYLMYASWPSRSWHHLLSHMLSLSVLAPASPQRPRTSVCSFPREVVGRPHTRDTARHMAVTSASTRGRHQVSLLTYLLT